MLGHVFKALDEWIVDHNSRSFDEGLQRIKSVEFKIVGQSALLEADLGITLANTSDVDAYTQMDYMVRQELNRLLAQIGKTYDDLSEHIWMPAETEYFSIYSGTYVEALVAKPEYVLISKALKSKEKNALLLKRYKASGTSEVFDTLAKKYGIIIE
jgi:hypothetical protein